MMEIWTNIQGVLQQFVNGELSRTENKLVFACILVAGAMLLGVFMRFVGLSDAQRARRGRNKMRAEVANRAPIGATSAEVDAFVADEVRRMRAEVFDIPALDLRFAPRPHHTDYYPTVRDFALEKQRNTEVLNEYENFAIGQVAFVEKLLGTPDLSSLDELRGNIPYRSHELRNAMARIGVPKFGDYLAQAVEQAMRRHIVITDMINVGMSFEDARTHATLESYDSVAGMIHIAGGVDRLIHDANRYFEGAYPWAAQEPAFT